MSDLVFHQPAAVNVMQHKLCRPSYSMIDSCPDFGTFTCISLHSCSSGSLLRHTLAGIQHVAGCQSAMDCSRLNICPASYRGTFSVSPCARLLKDTHMHALQEVMVYLGACIWLQILKTSLILMMVVHMACMSTAHSTCFKQHHLPCTTIMTAVNEPMAHLSKRFEQVCESAGRFAARSHQLHL